jgi:hypothetical protein
VVRVADRGQGDPGLSGTLDSLPHRIDAGDVAKPTVAVDDKRTAPISDDPGLGGRFDLACEQPIEVSRDSSGPVRVNTAGVGMDDDVGHQRSVIDRQAGAREQRFHEPLQSYGVDAPLRLHARIAVHRHSFAVATPERIG